MMESEVFRRSARLCAKRRLDEEVASNASVKSSTIAPDNKKASPKVASQKKKPKPLTGLQKAKLLIKEKEDEIKKLKRQNRDMKNQLDELKELLDESRSSFIEQVLRITNDVHEDYKTKVEAHKTKEKELLEVHQEMQTKITKLKKDKKKLKKLNKMADEAVIELEEKVEKMQKETDDLSAKKDLEKKELEERIASLQAQLLPINIVDENHINDVVMNDVNENNHNNHEEINENIGKDDDNKANDSRFVRLIESEVFRRSARLCAKRRLDEQVASNASVKSSTVAPDNKKASPKVASQKKKPKTSSIMLPLLSSSTPSNIVVEQSRFNCKTRKGRKQRAASLKRKADGTFENGGPTKRPRQGP